MKLNVWAVNFRPEFFAEIVAATTGCLHFDGVVCDPCHTRQEARERVKAIKRKLVEYGVQVPKMHITKNHIVLDA